MLQSILAVDSLAIQRSLTILEERYRELREIGEKRFEAWDSEKAELKQQLAAQAETLQQAQKTRDDHAAKLKTLEGDLAALKGERDAAAKEKATALQSATELKQQLAAQAETLQQTQEARDEQTARVKGLEAELATLKDERDTAAKEKAAAQQSATELKQQLTAQAETLQQTQKTRDEQATKLKTLEGDLATLKGERDGAAKEKATALQSATELKQQLAAQAETLQQTQKARDEQAAKVKILEGELATLNTRQSSVAAGLQRLRDLAHPAGRTS